MTKSIVKHFRDNGHSYVHEIDTMTDDIIVYDVHGDKTPLITYDSLGYVIINGSIMGNFRLIDSGNGDYDQWVYQENVGDFKREFDKGVQLLDAEVEISKHYMSKGI